MAAALVGALFYGFAGVNHLRQPHRKRMENIALVSDLFIAAVLLVVCVTPSLTFPLERFIFGS